MIEDAQMKNSDKFKVLCIIFLVIACISLIAILVTFVFGKQISVSSGYGVAILKTIRLFAIICGVVSIAATAITATKFAGGKTEGAEPAEFEYETKTAADEQETITAINKYASHSEVGVYAKTLKQYIFDINTFKKQLKTIKDIAYSESISRNAEFIVSELEDIDDKIYSMVQKAIPAFEYYVQFGSKQHEDAEQYKKTAISSITKCATNVGKLIDYYKNIVNILDKAVSEEDVVENNLIFEAEATLRVMKTFVKKEEL
jgi:hypothetical protein